MAQKSINFVTCNLISDCATCSFKAAIENQPIVLCSSPATKGKQGMLIFQNQCSYRGTFAVTINEPEAVTEK